MSLQRVFSKREAYAGINAADDLIRALPRGSARQPRHAEPGANRPPRSWALEHALGDDCSE